MNSRKYLILILVILVTGILGAGCNPQSSCEFTGNMALSVYRLPDVSSDFFGTMNSGETHTALAYTSDGWIGFDPGFAQAGNIGLAHHRWFQLNAVVTPSCLSSIPLVTLADVQADLAASVGP